MPRVRSIPPGDQEIISVNFVPRIIFNLATGAVVDTSDEDMEKNGAEVKSNLEASFQEV